MAIELILLIAVILLVYLFSSFLLVTKYANTIVAFILLFCFCGFVTYTPDSDVYQNYIDLDIDKDFTFNILRKYSNAIFGSEYVYLHMVYMFINSLMLVYFVSQFKKGNYIITILLFLLANYVFFTTQIRFFLGYTLALNSLYLFHVKNRRNSSLLLMIFGILSHISIIFFIPFFFLYKISVKKMIKVALVVSPLLLLLFYFLNSYVSFLGIDESYIGESSKSTFLGGFSYFLPYIIIFLVVYNSVIEEGENKEIRFLLKLSIYSMILLPLAFTFQIVGHRFIVPAILLQLVLVLYIKTKWRVYLILFFILISNISIIPLVLGLDTNFIDQAILMLNSIKI